MQNHDKLQFCVDDLIAKELIPKFMNPTLSCHFIA